MRKSRAFLALALIASGYLIYAYAHGTADSHEPGAARGAVRGMSAFLGQAPIGIVTQLAPHSDAAQRALASQAAAPTASPTSATQAGLERVVEIERSISSHYPEGEAGAAIRRFVALVLGDVDSEMSPDTSRNRMIKEMMKDPVSAATALQSSLSLIAPEATAERSAVLKLVTHLGTSDPMLPAVEGILLTEITRKSPADLGDAEALVNQQIDAYTMLFSDVRKQVAFIRAGIQAQDDPRLRDALQDRLDLLQRLSGG